MAIQPTLSDAEILEDLGRRLAARRVDLGLTQGDLASRAGVGKRTIERIESGRSVQLTNLVALFRELDLLRALDALLPEAGPRPMDLLRGRGSVRRRVGSRRRAPSNTSTTDDQKPGEAWTWDDDQEEGSS